MAFTPQCCVVRVVPAITTLMIWTNTTHLLMWHTRYVVDTGEFSLLVSEPAIWSGFTPPILTCSL